MKLTLEGLKLIAFETGASAPFCSRLLADVGMDVYKIERPLRGDVSREWDTIASGWSSGFVWLNRNKKSVMLNTKTAEGREIINKLIERSDVFLQNFTPEAIERLGLSYKEICAINPKIIYCGISGYGKEGPYRDAKAYDLIMQGETGLIGLTGYPDRPAKITLSICDICAGMYAMQAILLALYHRERTGEGQEIDISMFDSMLSWLGYFPYFWWYKGIVPAREGLRHQLLVPYGPFLAKDDRYVNFACLSNEDFLAFCETVIERPELAKDARFTDNERRLKNRSGLEAIIERTVQQEDSDFWFGRLKKADLPYGRLNNIDEVLSHPQTIHRHMVKEIDTTLGRIKVIDSPMKMSKSTTILKNIPKLGEHTDQTLEMLGYSAGAIKKLHSEGIV